MISGFLNVNKTKGETSNRTLSRIKRILKAKGIVTKVGHFGTLDPDGEGVLPVALGRATRLFDYTLDKIKVYYTRFVFGATTDTLDTSGKIIEENPKVPSVEEIKAALNKLTGVQMQIPPAYSAKSVNGQRAYDLARKGIEVDLKPKQIEVYSIDFSEEIKNRSIELTITASGGTYIRSIARDLGILTDSFCIMQYIRRLKSGIFEIEDSKTIEELEDNFESNIIPLTAITNGFQRYDIPESKKDLALNGVKIKLPNLPNGTFAVYSDGELIGLAEESDSALNIKTWLK